MATTLQSSRFTEAGLKALVEDNMSNWESFSVTSSYSGTTHTGYKRRMGANLELMIDAAFDGSEGGSYTITLPDSHTIDETVTGTSSRLPLGWGSMKDNSDGGTVYHCMLGRNNSTSLRVFLYSSDEADAGGFIQAEVNGVDMDTTAAPFESASGDTAMFRVSVPVTGFATSQNSLVGFSEATSSAPGLISNYAVSDVETTLSGITTTITTDVHAVRVGNVVSVTVESHAGATKDGSAGTINYPGSLPVGFRPTHEIAYVIPALIGGTNSTTGFRISTNGDLKLFNSISFDNIPASTSDCRFGRAFSFSFAIY